jgi:transcriptional regulator with XRE-family HTH domain
MHTFYYFDTTMPREISPIGKNIKKLRKQKGLSQDRLSKLADISYNTVIKLESGGITNPSINTLQKLAKAFDVSVDELLK